MNIGGKYYEKEVEQDLLFEPHDVCDVDRRKRCDSLFASLNRKLLKENRSLVEKNEHLNTKLILISDLLYCNQLSEDLKKEILSIIEDEKVE